MEFLSLSVYKSYENILRCFGVTLEKMDFNEKFSWTSY